MTKARTIGLVAIIVIALGAQTGAQSTTAASRTDSRASTSTGWTKKTPWGDPDLSSDLERQHRHTDAAQPEVRHESDLHRRRVRRDSRRS